MHRCQVPASPQRLLAPGLLFIFGYWLMCSAILLSGWWRYEAPPLRRASWVLWLPTVTAVANIAEYLLLVRLLYRDSDGQFHLHGDGLLHSTGDHYGFLNWLLLTASWTKWLSAAATLVAVVIAASVWYSRRADPFPPWQPATLSPRHGTHELDWTEDSGCDPEKHAPGAQAPVGGGPPNRGSAGTPQEGTERDGGGARPTEPAAGVRAQDGDRQQPAPQRVGICLSGGGIRSSAFCLGVLSELEADVAGRDAPTKAARYLAAVSGGAWAAAVWTLQKASQPAVVASTAIIEGLKAEVEPAGYPAELLDERARGNSGCPWLGALERRDESVVNRSAYLSRRVADGPDHERLRDRLRPAGSRALRAGDVAPSRDSPDSDSPSIRTQHHLRRDRSAVAGGVRVHEPASGPHLADWCDLDCRVAALPRLFDLDSRPVRAERRREARGGGRDRIRPSAGQSWSRLPVESGNLSAARWCTNYRGFFPARCRDSWASCCCWAEPRGRWLSCMSCRSRPSRGHRHGGRLRYRQ